MTEIIQLYISPIPHANIIWPWKDRQNAKNVFPISDGNNVTSIHDKANLITYQMWSETVSE